MSSHEPIEKIEKLTRGSDKTGTNDQSTLERAAPNKEHFDSLLQGNTIQAQATPAITPIEPTEKTSLIDTVRDLNYTGPKDSQGALVSQTKEAITQIEEIKNLLGTENLHIKSSVQQMMHNKLTHIDDNLKIALSKAGIEVNPTTAEAAVGRVNPIERFLGFLTQGQYNLQHLGEEIQSMSDRKQELTPANMLAIQVKVTQIQQELELFTSMLAKALDSIKTIMNIQV